MCALGSLDRKLKFQCIYLDENLAGADLLPKFGIYGRHHAVDLAADPYLIRRDQAAGKIDDALDCNTLGRRRPDLNDLSPSTPAAPLATPLIILLRVSRSAACLKHKENGKKRERSEEILRVQFHKKSWPNTDRYVPRLLMLPECQPFVLSVMTLRASW